MRDAAGRERGGRAAFCCASDATPARTPPGRSSRIPNGRRRRSEQPPDAGAGRSRYALRATRPAGHALRATRPAAGTRCVHPTFGWGRCVLRDRQPARSSSTIASTCPVCGNMSNMRACRGRSDGIAARSRASDDGCSSSRARAGSTTPRASPRARRRCRGAAGSTITSSGADAAARANSVASPAAKPHARQARSAALSSALAIASALDLDADHLARGARDVQGEPADAAVEVPHGGGRDRADPVARLAVERRGHSVLVWKKSADEVQRHVVHAHRQGRRSVSTSSSSPSSAAWCRAAR